MPDNKKNTVTGTPLSPKKPPICPTIIRESCKDNGICRCISCKNLTKTSSGQEGYCPIKQMRLTVHTIRTYRSCNSWDREGIVVQPKKEN